MNAPFRSLTSLISFCAVMPATKLCSLNHDVFPLSDSVLTWINSVVLTPNLHEMMHVHFQAMVVTGRQMGRVPTP